MWLDPDRHLTKFVERIENPDTWALYIFCVFGFTFCYNLYIQHSRN